MSAKQPTRKPTGKRKESDTSALEGRERKRAAKRKGLKAGTRQQVAEPKNNGNKQVQDPRLGSRKPVVLIVDDKQSKPKPAKAPREKILTLTPEQELAAIENDDRLNDFLDRLDEGETLSAADQAWVDQRVDRYQELMDELGIIDDEDEEEPAIMDDFEEAQAPATEEDLWDRFNKADYQPQPVEPKKK